MTVNQVIRIALGAAEKVDSNFRSSEFIPILGSSNFDENSKLWRVKLNGMTCLIDDSSKKAIAVTE